ncbi:hypothetical protein HDU93_005183 [Gonapodya sp. JEL0774]|nr:hypothetical protein HDU93_005183 [Gonapodya sp. JEL0774]
MGSQSHASHAWNPQPNQPPFSHFPSPIATRRRKYNEISDDSSDSSPSDTPRSPLRSSGSPALQDDRFALPIEEMDAISFTPSSKRPKLEQTLYSVTEPVSESLFGRHRMQPQSGTSVRSHQHTSSHGSAFPAGSFHAAPGASGHKRHRTDDEDDDIAHGLEARPGTATDGSLEPGVIYSHVEGDGTPGAGAGVNASVTPPRGKRARTSRTSTSPTAERTSTGVVIEDVTDQDWAHGHPTTVGVVTSPSGRIGTAVHNNGESNNTLWETARVVELDSSDYRADDTTPLEIGPHPHPPLGFSSPHSTTIHWPTRYSDPPTPQPSHTSNYPLVNRASSDFSDVSEPTAEDFSTSLVPVLRRPETSQPPPPVFRIDVLSDAWRARQREWELGDRRAMPGMEAGFGGKRGEMVLFRGSAGPVIESEGWERIPNERIQEITGEEDFDQPGESMMVEEGSDMDERADVSGMDLDD